MATELLIDPSQYPLDQIYMTGTECGRFNPQRFEFAQITNVLSLDKEANLIVAHRHVGDEFWARGHLPGRPLFPGVLMIECMAQCASVHAHLQTPLPEGGFIGFGGIDDVRFREPVTPGTDLLIAGSVLKASPKRSYFKWKGQMMKLDGTIVAEATVTGVGF
ncbi:MAG: beta-hydroxyacyl-ACP dehydratase [Planctomycetes bacterium]|jgi:3-hydroxyacyl-[acyl-carrier-protein] dehydratase|nr:beta-hydroxyacyl-ACP dehydratase [Planctomycetota bacterium]MBT4029268.1 beta-hydroxyacyl-ACP dehydratase [Planctomycetota bacterium]MBT4560459.1 beta-hydroxyacyl-ACP dehydratase [Planctomycetota bacterium]MBT5100427.1 beta-hydroxyacyl-ACP dehydratase [Planctomycetota bacterium]MBT5119211.1 beta-hydroxyacyl-ACP dehydratase [Planctomycetota bacterium]